MYTWSIKLAADPSEIRVALEIMLIRPEARQESRSVVAELLISTLSNKFKLKSPFMIKGISKDSKKSISS